MYILLTAVDIPKIIKSPSSQTKTFGENVTFTIVFSGKGTLSYQWYKDDDKITMDSHPYCTCEVTTESQETTSTLEIKDVLTEYEGVYLCVVSNEAGIAESDRAQLGVGTSK